MRNQEKDAIQMAANRQKIMQAGYDLFVKRTIDGVSLDEVAKTSKIGIATLYRYYGNKVELVIAIAVWKWGEFLKTYDRNQNESGGEHTGAENLANYLDTYLDLYRNHKDLLRFNQFFNVYLQGSQADKERTALYQAMIDGIADRFRMIWEKGAQDGTMRTDTSTWQKAFSSTLHIMLAAITRYAVGLVYQPAEGAEPEEELKMLRDMLYREYTA